MGLRLLLHAGPSTVVWAEHDCQFNTAHTSRCAAEHLRQYKTAGAPPMGVYLLFCVFRPPELPHLGLMYRIS